MTPDEIRKLADQMAGTHYDVFDRDGDVLAALRALADVAEAQKAMTDHLNDWFSKRLAPMPDGLRYHMHNSEKVLAGVETLKP